MSKTPNPQRSGNEVLLSGVIIGVRSLMGFPGVEQPTRLNRANPKSSRAVRSLNYSDSPEQTPQFPAQTWQQYGLARA